MAAMHLTSDNGAASESRDKHLAGVEKDASSHLVVVRQMADWTDREFVVTPNKRMFAVAAASGVEAHGGEWGGAAVRADTQILIDDVVGTLSRSGWSEGDKPIFSYSTRRNDPTRMAAGNVYYNEYSGYGMSVIAHRFDLRHLHLSKMSFHAYLRLYVPSMLTCLIQQEFMSDGTIVPQAFYDGASELVYRFFDELPQTASPVEGTDADAGQLHSVKELWGVANEGRVVSRDTSTNALLYDPVGLSEGTRSSWGSALPLRVYAINERSLFPETSFHADVEISGRQLEFLRGNPGEFWMLSHMHPGNMFSSGGNMQGLIQKACGTVFVQRIELVLKCTSGKFNT